MGEAHTTIRLKSRTKSLLENLDFVKKQSFDQIIIELINFYKRKEEQK